VRQTGDVRPSLRQCGSEGRAQVRCRGPPRSAVRQPQPRRRRAGRDHVPQFLQGVDDGPVASAGVEVQVWLLLQLPTRLRHPLEQSSEPDASDQSSERFTCTTNLLVRLL
jgi:hypothetical protein